MTIRCPDHPDHGLCPACGACPLCKHWDDDACAVVEDCQCSPAARRDALTPQSVEEMDATIDLSERLSEIEGREGVFIPLW